MPEASGGQASVVFQAPVGDRIDSPENAAALAAVIDDIYRIDHVIDPRALLAAQATAASPPDTSAEPTDPSVSPSDPEETVARVGPLVVAGQPVPGVMVSSTGRVAMLQVQFTDQVFELPTGTLEAVMTTAEQAANGTGITVLSGATLGIPEILGVGESLGVGVAAIVLLITLGSVVAAGLPLLTAFTGVVIGVGGAYALSNVIQLCSDR
ncbi:MMPL family transporter [Cellulomonas hominis]